MIMSVICACRSETVDFREKIMSSSHSMHHCGGVQEKFKGIEAPQRPTTLCPALACR